VSYIFLADGVNLLWRIDWRTKCTWSFWTLRMKTPSCYKTSVTIFQSIRCHVIEDCNFHHRYCKNTKSLTKCRFVHSKKPFQI